MTRHVVGPMIALLLCGVLSLAYSAEKGRNKGGESSAEQKEHEEKGGEGKKQGANKNNKKAPGGSWSEDSHEGQKSNSQNHAGAEGAAAKNHNESQPTAAQGAAAGAAAKNRNQPQATGAQGAAAGAAVSKNNQPQATGAQGAAAGAAVSKNNQPQYSGAQGAAAGAAAAKNNEPKYSGAQGAAAGAAVSKNNQPQYSGAQGAAAGAAVSKNNQPQYSGAQGAAAGAAVAKNNQPQFSGAQGAAAGAAVRNSFDHPEIYGQQWYGEHQGLWAPAGLAAGAVWAPTAWGTVASACGYAGGTPVSYNYGSNVTCQQGNVMVDGQNVGTAEEYSQQASDLANTGVEATTADSDQWMPLGVFAMVRNEKQHPQLILQLAVNSQGVLRGNYTDEVTDHSLPIRGAVDGQTQRAAWIVGDNQNSVMEAGLSNLTQTETRALLHKNGKTERWLLVRLDQPAQGQN